MDYKALYRCAEEKARYEASLLYLFPTQALIKSLTMRYYKQYIHK